MNLDKEGKLDIPSRWTYRIFEEFGFNMEEMADAILDLRKELEENEENHQKEVDALNEEIRKLESED